MKERLCVVMPVYNEQDAIGPVLEKWDAALKGLGIDYVIRPYNDGSKDSSLTVMREAAKRLGERVDVRDKVNGGHGNTILTGYREAAADGFDWVFQIDSDDEMGPEKFGELWARRKDYDFLAGIRDGRVQALPRKIISFVSRMCVRIFYGKSVWDVNTPYRLMRVSAFKEFFNAIPLTTFAPNVVLSGLAARYKLRCYEMRVPQHDRTTGEVSIKKWKLLKAAGRSFVQTIILAIRTARVRDWFRYVFWGACWGLALASVVVGFINGFREYDFQWDPAKLLMMGDNPYVYSLEHKAIPYGNFMEKYIEANQLPSCLLLLAPWTFLPQLLANQVWDVCNLFFTGIFLVYLYKTFFDEDACIGKFFIVPLILLAGTPWRMLIGNGQHLMFSLAFFMPAYFYAQKRRYWLAGLLLALSGFKYTTVAPLAFIFISHRWWKPIAVAAALHIIATLGCAVWLGESPITLCVQSLQVGSMLTAQGLCDWASLMREWGVNNVTTWAHAGYAIGGLLLIMMAFRKVSDNLLFLSILSVIANIMFYHRAYDFVVLVFPLVYVLIRSGGGCLSFVRIATILNIAWTFFFDKISVSLHLPINAVIVTTFLEHALLVSLFVVLFSSHGTQSSNLRVDEKVP